MGQWGVKNTLGLRASTQQEEYWANVRGCTRLFIHLFSIPSFFGVMVSGGGDWSLPRHSLDIMQKKDELSWVKDFIYQLQMCTNSSDCHVIGLCGEEKTRWGQDKHQLNTEAENICSLHLAVSEKIQQPYQLINWCIVYNRDLPATLMWAFSAMLYHSKLSIFLWNWAFKEPKVIVIFNCFLRGTKELGMQLMILFLMILH